MKSRQCPTLVGFDRKGQARVIFCGQWSCPTCRKKLARKWAIRTRLHVQTSQASDNQQWYFITLTLGSGFKSVTQAYTALAKLWDTLRKAFRREHGAAWQYISFVEGQPHRQFMPHFHIICNRVPLLYKNAKGEIVEHRVHTFAHKYGFGYQSKCKVVNDMGAADYVAKYAGKSGETMPRNFRRVRTSQNFHKLPADPNRLLLVRTKHEEFVHFIDRVSAFTGVEHLLLVSRFFEANDLMLDLRDP